jgi:GT2 family glycosyltransferase
MSATAKATVIVVNYNGAHLLPACLDGLAAQADDAPSFTTVVLDNASVDGSRELLAREYPWVQVIASSQNLGFAGGNNVALCQVTTPYAVLLNNDATPQRGWLRALIDTFEQPGNHDVGLVTGKVVFAPKFVPVHLRTAGFRPASSDTRELGVQVRRVLVDDIDVTERVLWGHAAYGPEGTGPGRFRWTRPDGEFLLPVPASLADANQTLTRPSVVTVWATAERAKSLALAVDGQQVSADVDTSQASIELTLKVGTDVVDVINNVGGLVLRDGSGADRGFQEIDRGQYDEPGDVFTACGNGMALRTPVGRELGWFDDSFFMYYEDTDLSWRWRSRGWTVRYAPSAVLRHVHSATSVEWSPQWRFFVERNRLLMLTKNATVGLAGRAILAYVRNWGASLTRALLGAVRVRRIPALRSQALSARVLVSFGRRAPHALLQRRRIRRRATVAAQELEAWLVSSR